MKSKFTLNKSFLLNFFIKNDFPNVLRRISFNYNSFHSEIMLDKKMEDGVPAVYIANLIPTYLMFETLEAYGEKKISQSNKGYAIFLEGYSDVNTYVSDVFKKNSNQIIRKLNRLEYCYSIQFKVFNENINTIEYQTLMSHFKKMLTARFHQRNDRNENLDNWDSLVKETLPLLKKKRASLFIIYENKIPISITLGYHFNQVLFSSIPAYDIAFSKYGLGNIAIFKTVQWCLENDYKILEMGYGDLEYKRRWCNLIYNYDTIVFYRIKYFTSFIAFFIIKYFSSKEYIKKTTIFKWFVKIKTAFLKSSKDIGEHSEWTYSINEYNQPIPVESHIITNLYKKEYDSIRKVVCDFQFLNFEKRKNVKIYKLINSESYLLIGDKKKVILKRDDLTSSLKDS